MNTSSPWTNARLQESARRLIPGGAQLFSKRPDQFAPGLWPTYYQKAKGHEVWDMDGNRYEDMGVSAVGGVILGYADDEIDAAARNAVAAGTNCSLNCPEEVWLAEELCSLHSWAGKVRFARTGGEAMAVAVRIARAHSRRDVVAFCGYHGWHDWYLAANLTGSDALSGHLLEGLSPLGVPQGLRGTAFPFRYNHLEDLQQITVKHGAELAAIIMEPIRNYRPVAGFLEGVRRLAEETGAVMIFDEISAGFRLNTGGAHLEFGVIPDMAVFSKALGNGYPIAAVLGKEAVMESAQETFISSLNWTERLGYAAALAVIEKHRRLRVGTHLIRIGEQVQQGWRESAKRHSIELDVTGIPPLSHFTFKEQESLVCKTFFVQQMLERGLLASTFFYPMLTHTEPCVNAYLAAVDAVFAEMARLRSSGRLREALKGRPAVGGFQRLT